MELFARLKTIWRKIFFYTPSFSCKIVKICASDDKNEPMIQFIETEFTGRKTSSIQSISDVVNNIETFKRFNTSDRNIILSCAFDVRLSIGFHRYSLSRIIFSDKFTSVQLVDKQASGEYLLSFNIIGLVENNNDILGNISSADLTRILYTYNVCSNMSINEHFENIKKTKKANRHLNFKVINGGTN